MSEYFRKSKDEWDSTKQEAMEKLVKKAFALNLGPLDEDGMYSRKCSNRI